VNQKQEIKLGDNSNYVQLQRVAVIDRARQTKSKEEKEKKVNETDEFVRSSY